MSLNQFPRRSFVGSSTLQTFSGTGSQTAFTLSSTQTQNECFVFVDDVVQVPGVDFTVNGTTLTFTSAPANAAEIIVRGFGVPAPVTTVSDGAITAAKLATGAIEAKLGYTPVSATQLSTEVANLVDSAPSTLNTLNELAAALGDDANYATTVTNALATKANTSSLATVATSGSYNDLTNKPAITPTAVSDQSNSSTGYFDLPTGTTAQRPGSPNAGMIRLNSEQSTPEIYIGSAWSNIALSGLVRSNLVLNLDPALYTAGSSTWVDSAYSGLTFNVGNSANTTKPTSYIIDDTTGSTYAYYTSNIASTTFGTSDFTIECWIYINTTNYGSWRYIFGKSNFWGTGEYGLYINDNGTALGFHTTATNGVQIALSSIGTGWKHITAVRSSSGRKLYVNSALVVSDSVVDNCNATTGTYYGCSSSGGNYTDSTYKLGSARMYSKALSETEVSTNFAYERSRYGV